MAFPYDRPVTEYDPLRIHLAPEYIFLENIYSTLVEISPKGELVPAVAERFEWINDTAVFTIRKDLKTIDGISITANDAAFSLKRMLVSEPVAYSHIREMLCGGKAIKSIHDDCSGIEVKHNSLILKPQSKKAFLFPMLASIDFAVIPEHSVDPVSLAIRDYRNTSGVYYVDEDLGKGNIKLKVNKNHYHYSKNIAQNIVIVPTNEKDPQASVRAFKNGEVDFLTTVDAARPEDVIAFARHNHDVNLHMTLNIRTMTVSFTERGLAEITPDERRTIGNAIRRAFLKHVKDKHIEGYESANQYFSVFGEAGLSAKDVAKIQKLFAGSANVKVPSGLKMQLVRVGEKQLWQDIVSPVLPGISIDKGANLPAFSHYANQEEIPHFVITGPDTGWMEDIGLITYTIKAGYFGMSRGDGKKWLERYAKIKDKKNRLNMLREAHYQALHDGILIPFAVAPYVAVSRKTWNMSLSAFFANNQFWLVTRNQDS